MRLLFQSIRFVTRCYRSGWLAIAMVTLVVCTLPALSIYLMSMLIDLAAGYQSLGREPADSWGIVSVIVLLVAVWLCSDLLHGAQYLLIDHVRDRTRLEARSSFMRRVTDVDLPSLELMASDGRLSAMAKAIEPLGLIVEYLALTASTVLTTLVLIILGASVAWWLPAALLLAFLPAVIVRQRLDAMSFKVEQKFAEDYRRAATVESMFLSARSLKELRIWKLSDYLLQKWQGITQSHIKTAGDARRSGYLKMTLVSALGAAVAGVCVGYVVFQAVEGTMSPGAVAIVVGLVAQINGSLGGTFFSLNRLIDANREVVELIKFLHDVASTQPARTQVLITAEPASHAAALVLEHVGFHYPNATAPALEDINLSLELGQTLAIVGENGAGKSTLAKIIAGLYRPDAGVVRVSPRLCSVEEGSSIGPLTAGVIFQDYADFPVSAAWSVALSRGGKAVDVARIKESLIFAGLEHLAADPLSFEEDAFFRPDLLSGGQQQRLALARAHHARDEVKLWLFDEPTSALDPQAEYEFFERMLKLAAGLTTVVVTHRMALARRAQQIVVLHHGRIVEQGSHDQLVALNQRYARMFNQQAAPYERSTTSHE